VRGFGCDDDTSKGVCIARSPFSDATTRLEKKKWEEKTEKEMGRKD
jgi:hypothetical protein